jgi:hypothetical protein
MTTLKSIQKRKYYLLYKCCNISEFFRILKEPQNLIEMEEAIALHELLVAEVPRKEEMFPFITDQMVVLEKYNVHVPNDVRIREKAIPTEWTHYLDILAEADKMLGYSKVLVRGHKENRY